MSYWLKLQVKTWQASTLQHSAGVALLRMGTGLCIVTAFYYGSVSSPCIGSMTVEFTTVASMIPSKTVSAWVPMQRNPLSHGFLFWFRECHLGFLGGMTYTGEKG